MAEKMAIIEIHLVHSLIAMHRAIYVSVLIYLILYRAECNTTVNHLLDRKLILIQSLCNRTWKMYTPLPKT